MTQATNEITQKFKRSFIRVANVSEFVAAQKLMHKLGFKRFFGGRKVDNREDIRFIYVNSDCEMIHNYAPARGSDWDEYREINFEELSKAVLEVNSIKRAESKASKKRKALRKWDATATKRTTEQCPVRRNVLVSIRLKNGATYSGEAGKWDWTDGPDGLRFTDIESYKVLSKNKHRPLPEKGTTLSLEQMVTGIAESLGREVAIPVTSAEILDASNNVIGTTSVKEVASPDTNPKRQYGVSSVPLNMWSPLASAYGALGLYNGSLKYGAANFANTPVEASIYIAAAMRHLLAWAAGQEDDPADGVPNLGGVLANVAILLESRAAGMLIDDRLLMSGYLKEIEMLKEKVKHLNALHAGKTPKHYTRDNV